MLKRLFSPPFVDLLAAKLRAGGLLHFKSDVREYGELVDYHGQRHEAFSGNQPDLVALHRRDAPTHREHWCNEHGRPVYTYAFARLA